MQRLITASTPGILALTACMAILLAFKATQAQSTASPSSLFPENFFPELERILDHASQAAPEIMIERARLDASAAGIDIADSNTLPDIGVSAQLALRNEFRDKDPEYQFIATPFGRFYIRQRLYYWGAIDARREIAHLQDAIARQQAEEVRRLLMLRIRSHFLESLLARQEAILENNRVELLDTELQRLEIQLQQERIQPDELELTAIERDEAALLQERAKARETTAIDNLKFVSGWQSTLDPVTEQQLQQFDDLYLALFSIEEAHFHSGPTDSTGFRQKMAQLEIEKQNKTIISSQTLPNIDLVGESFLDQVDSSGEDNANRIVAQAFVQISWNFFDGFQTKYEKIQNLARQRQLRKEAELALEQHRREYQRLQRERTFIRGDIRNLERRTTLSQRQMELRQRGLDEGVVTLSDYITSRQTFNTNTLKLFRMKLLYVRNTIQLLSMAGKDPFVSEN